MQGCPGLALHNFLSVPGSKGAPTSSQGAGQTLLNLSSYGLREEGHLTKSCLLSPPVTSAEVMGQRTAARAASGIHHPLPLGAAELGPLDFLQLWVWDRVEAHPYPSTVKGNTLLPGTKATSTAVLSGQFWDHRYP